MDGDTITQVEGEDILTELLSNVAEDDDHIEALATKFELSEDNIRVWLEKVQVKASLVNL